ncbi:AraC family transcriptional regulator [Marinomonas sp. C2222]|uniref:AraC family transcriptional regulator n=1 Tax=Marinomonas sargassi TaxID=2984494 RepID=A0ABT2YQG8_9GAMM|nr:AraC family transcriptional regulator [Marinomonas sargassi]MCV2402143.1 AraC family transcriptional regulator [Marinomonas sargassi]
MRKLIEVIDYQGTEKVHNHEHTQIVIPLSGSIVLEVESHQQLISSGQACLISVQQNHTHLAEVKNHCLVLNSLPIWDKKIESKHKFIDLSEQVQAYLPFLSCLQDEPSQSIKARQALNMLEHLIPIPQEKIILADTRLEKAKHLIDTEFQEHWSLESLANEVHLSSSQLSVLFKRYFAMTPKQYLLERRLKEVRSLLCTSNKSLDFIAQKVGLNNASQLVKLFSKNQKVTPGKYRKMHLN